MSPKFKDNRYSRAIKVAMNRLFSTKSVVHKDISKLITEFSHKTMMKENTCLMSSRLEFFVVAEILSSHFCKGFYCPYTINRRRDGYIYVPNLWRCSALRVKKIHAPFSDEPFVKDRKWKFLTRDKVRHGEMQAHRTIFEHLY